MEETTTTTATSRGAMLSSKKRSREDQQEEKGGPAEKVLLASTSAAGAAATDISPSAASSEEVVAVVASADNGGEEGVCDDDNRKPPPYGSQQYWEDRYQRLAETCVNADDVPDPFHALYFNWNELAPLILPLILGEPAEEEEEEEEEVEVQESDDEEIEEKESCEAFKKEGSNQSSSAKDCSPTKSSTASSNKDKQKEGTNVDNECESNDEEEEDASVGHDDDDNNNNNNNSDEDDEEEGGGFIPSNRDGLAKNGPISVFEVGCGDVPLGRDLALAIQDLEQSAGAEATKIVEKVVCVDYSRNVIEAMREEQKLRDSKRGKSTIPVVYEEADARHLSYADESFDILLEKGTLDAMLSGGDGNGSDNCRLIVAECARVLKRGGCMVIVSHLNAHVDTGLQWLNEVIVPGLRRGAGRFGWNVEVHGSEADIPSDTDVADEDGEKDVRSAESPGPCVYIVRKGNSPLPESDYGPSDAPTIPLRFFAY